MSSSEEEMEDMGAAMAAGFIPADFAHGEPVPLVRDKLPGLFVSRWDDDEAEDNLENWTEEEIRKDPAKRMLISAENGDVETVRSMLADIHHPVDRAALVNVHDNDGYSPLHRASYGGHLEMAKLLLESGAELDARTQDGWAPLHSAAFWNRANVCELLLARGASPNVRTAGGQTPLHLAVSNNESPETIELLLRHPNLDRTRANNMGETAETLARRLSPFAALFDSIQSRENENAGDACGVDMSLRSSDSSAEAGHK